MTPPLPALSLLPCKGGTGTSGPDFEHCLTKFFGIHSNETSPEPQSPNLFLSCSPTLKSNCQNSAVAVYCHYHCHLYNKCNPFAATLLLFSISGLCQLKLHLGLSSELHQLYQLCGQGGTGTSPAGTVGRKGGPDGTLSAVLSGSSFQAHLYWTLDQKAFFFFFFCLACKMQLKCTQRSHLVK